jgi:hypothetical protein
MSYTVRFDRGNRGWTCSVFALDGNGMKSGETVASGTGTTQDAAKEAALNATSHDAIRAALTAADPGRPHWLQNGESHAAAQARVGPRTRAERFQAHRKERGERG